MVEAGDLNVDLFLHARIHDDEYFIQECYYVDCYMLNYAVELGQYDIVIALSTFPQIIKYLEMRDSHGKTPMDWAIHNKDSDMILFLVSKGANVSFHSVKSILWGAFV
jgi:hypothetical protein